MRASFKQSRRHCHRRRRRVLAIASGALAAAACSTAAPAVTLTLSSAKDNTLYEDQTGSLSNGAGDGMFAGKNGLGQIRRAVVAFDLPTLAPNAIVTSASLHLNCTQTLSTDAVSLHTVLKTWGQSTSLAGSGGGAGAPAVAGDVTWIHTFYNNQFWTNPGGDFTAAVSASASVGTGPVTFTSAQLAADVQGWINNPATNFGWLLTGNESATATAKRFATREYFDTSARPALIVNYSTSLWKTGGGNWSDAGNWNFGVPNVAGAEANFNNTGLPAAITVAVDSTKTVGTMNLGGPSAYTFTGSAINLSRTGGNNVVTVTAGNHTIAAPLNLLNTTTFTVPSGSTLTVSGDLTASTGANVNKFGAGKLVVNNLRADAANISGGGTLALAASGGASGGTSRVASLTITSSKLDLSDNKLIVNGGNVSTLTSLIQSGRNGGNWSGNGIITSQSAATAGNFTSIGIATAQQAKGLPSASATAGFSGQTVTGSDALIMYTYGGDANLDGKINVDDYGRIDFNVPLGTTGWFNGDFNYDGKINVDDYGIIDFNVGIQGPAFPTGTGLSGISVVPEPASMFGVFGAGALAWTTRRKLRSKGSNAR